MGNSSDGNVGTSPVSELGPGIQSASYPDGSKKISELN